MTCEAYFGVLNLLFHNFKDGFFYDDWVFVFLGISFPRWEAYGYTRDSNNIFGQTKNGSCYFPDPDNPYVPNNTVLPSNALVTSVIDSSYQFNRLLFHLDYFPQSFFGLMTDFNPYGASINYSN